MDIKDMSCADCSVAGCRRSVNYPDFCMTTHMDETVLAEALACYDDPENRQMMQVAAMVEHDGYLKWPRVQETMEFAKRMNFRKIGIATCVGLINETRILAGLLRQNGFEVFGIACKAGAVPKVDVGIDPICNEIGPHMCNPIMQAKMLNAHHTDMNIVMGLCVGHDMLFHKYAEAPTTTLVAKDRVTGHNPAAALYTANSYNVRLKNCIERDEQ
ncbi:MAG: DUF1847 domain-containing protein [Clostridia bacterium]|nr:DUF1847 domain-containing protein [Clostridia bacterium]